MDGLAFTIVFLRSVLTQDRLDVQGSPTDLTPAELPSVSRVDCELSGSRPDPKLSAVKSVSRKLTIKRIVKRVRERWPEVEIWFRGDSDFSRDEIMTWCEQTESVEYLSLAKIPIFSKH